MRYWLDSLLSRGEMILSIKLVGNKLDLVQENPSMRKVTQDEARNLCREHPNMSYIETSAMNAINVNNSF